MKNSGELTTRPGP